MRSLRALSWLALLSSGISACTCGKDNAAVLDGATIDESNVVVDARASVERPDDVERVWTEAKDGDESELMRLANREGAIGLVERSVDPRYRLTALRAMGYTTGYVAFPELGNAAKIGPEDEATVAVDSATMIAAQKRRQVDPEDALELRDGCDRLLEAAKDTSRPRAVRVGAVRALRMLTDRCVKAGDIPTDVDVK
jgi:hypothetical protein